MKLFSIGISLIALSVVGVSKLSSEPFKYKYEISVQRYIYLMMQH